MSKKILRHLLWSMAISFIALTSSQVYAANKITFYHYDLLGSPVATTNELGEVVWREEYSPYGEKLLNQDTGQDNVRGYTGHVFDEETGLTYMQARYYDPEIGRFMGVDPVGFQGSQPILFNRYAYANDNPYKFFDPNGKAGLLLRGLAAEQAYGAYAYGSTVPGMTAEQQRQTELAVDHFFSNAMTSLLEVLNESEEEVDDSDLVDLTGDRKGHILDGDKKGGGHRHGTGNPGKSEFPADWSDEEILDAISDVATDPDSERGTGKWGEEWAEGTRNGVDIHVDFYPPNSKHAGKISTGYPTNTSRNPEREDDSSGNGNE